MVNEYTAGPWAEIDTNDDGDIYIGSTDNLVAIVTTLPFSDRRFPEANARLIAAAPDLLEALMAVNDWLDDQSLVEPSVSRQGIRDAIAKATEATPAVEGRSDG